MATQTTHYNLIKPGGTDSVDISILNGNADILDDALYATDQLAACIASEYNSAMTYNTGDVVTHDGLTYRTAYNSVTGAWDSTKWSQVSLGDAISMTVASINSTINSRCGAIEGNISTLFSNYGQLMGMVWGLTGCIAPQYSTSKSYVVGDVCMNQQKLYRCTSDTTGTWDADAWETVYITDLL